MNITTNKSENLGITILAFAMLYFIWGSTFFFISIALKSFPPFTLGALRFLIAGIIFMSYSYLSGEQIFCKNNVKHSFISGIMLFFIGNGTIVWAEQYLPSGLVAIISCSIPLWFLLLDKPKWKENFSNKTTVRGLIIGFIGVILLFSEKFLSACQINGSQIQLRAVAILFLGCISWAGGSLYSKYKLQTGSVSSNISLQMLAASIFFIPLIFLRGEEQKINWNNIPYFAWLSLFYLILLGSIATFSAYIWLLKKKSVTQVSTYAYVNPIVAVLLGVFLANEKISFIQIMGLMIILGSVFIINFSIYRKKFIKKTSNSKAITNKVESTITSI